MATDRRGIIRFTIENMIKQCKFKVRTGEKESVSQFKKILYVLQRQSVVQILTDDEDNICCPLIENYKLKDLIMCTLTIDLTNKYVVLDSEEKNKIYSYDKEKINHLKVLLYYCYLKCRMYKRPKDDQMVVSGGRAEVTYPSFKQINKDLGFTDDTINKYNNILISLDMIRYNSAGLWYYRDDPNRIVRESCNIYTLFIDEETAKLNLKEGIKFWKNMSRNVNKIFTGNKDYKNNNKRLNGELGSIIKKEKNGTVAEKDIVRKNEILDSINANEEQYAIQALLESNPDTLLSDIYYDFNSDKKADMYYELEGKLELINDDGRMIVDYDYYKWVMINYNKDEHTYFVNCINKHKRNKPKHKGLVRTGKKDVVEDDSDFIAEMGWDVRVQKECDNFDEYIDWDE